MKSLFNHIGIKDISFRDHSSAFLTFSLECVLWFYLTQRRSWSPVKIFTRAYRATPTLWILHKFFFTKTFFILTCGIYYPLGVRWQKIWVICWAIFSNRVLRTLQLICIQEQYFIFFYCTFTLRDTQITPQ